MEEYKGIGYKFILNESGILVKEGFLKKNINYTDITALFFAEPKPLINGFIAIQAPQAYIKCQYSKHHKEEFLNMYQTVKSKCNEKIRSFKETKRFSTYMYLDENAKLVLTRGQSNLSLFSYDDIIDFELLEDSESLIKGGVGATIVGGALFGTVGAIAGSASKKKTKAVVKTIEILIRINDMNTPTVHILIQNTETKKSSLIYKANIELAQDIISVLNIITQEKNPTKTPEPVSSSADEILKFKNLMDQGIITPEEFSAKKKQLLGL